MKTGEIVRELINQFEYKKPLIYVEKIKKGKLTRPGAILDLLFFYDKDKCENCVLVQFYVAEDGILAIVSPTHNDEHEVYHGQEVKDCCVEVINWFNRYFKKKNAKTR